MDKGYLALVTGTLHPAEAIIEAPIGRDPNDRKKMAIVEDGREASTRYHTIARLRGFTYVDVRPKTGENAPDQGPFRIHRPPGLRRRDLRIPRSQAATAVPPCRKPGVRAPCDRE